MAMKIEIVSKEMIKPSSPTPQHLKEHKFSYLDQTVPSVYIPIIFFYEQATNQIHHGSFQELKTTLSLALTHYYPLAGRVRDNYIIDCNDTGALFVESKVDADLHQIIKNPEMDRLKQLLPAVDSNGIGKNCERVILAIQINRMVCGGTAIAVLMSHKLGDAHSLVTFMNSWAAIYRGAEIMQPVLAIASIFPPIDSSMMNVEETLVSISNEKIVTKRMFFDKEKLDILKHTAASGSQINDPTRVEVVSALIWKHFLETYKGESGRDKTFTAIQGVNLRPRMNPPLPDHTFGNIITIGIAVHEEGGLIGYQGLVGKFRDAINKVKETFGKNIPKGDEYVETIHEVMSKGETESFAFTSWSRFPVYEVDYRWGKPIWVTTTTFPVKNSAAILGTRTGDGLEVWINMLEDDASLLELAQTYS